MQMTLAKNDFPAAATALVDKSFMLFYQHVRSNTRRISQLIIALVPVMVLMVGSCKTPQSAYMADGLYGKTNSHQLQSDLFPGTTSIGGNHARPEAGYVAEARNYVDNQPHALLLLTSKDIGYIFGKPTFRRHDANAQVWQYKTRSCVIDFYFYGKKPAAYVDARLRDQSPVRGPRESECLHQINNGNTGVQI